MLSAASLDVLMCPNSSRQLRYSQDAKELCDVNGQYRYPVVAEIPWIFSDPVSALWQWKVSLTHQLTGYQKEEEQLRECLKTASTQMVKQRLQRLKEARMQDRRAIASLMKPLLNEPVPPVELARTLAQKVPLTQSLTGYYNNLHRDWAWYKETETGIDENLISLQIVQDAIAKSLTVSKESEPKLCVVFGAGSCRLAYDLHQSFNHTETIVVDINPLLFAVAKKAIEGVSVDLNEYPIAPTNLKNVAVQRVLKAPKKARSGFHFIHSDALHPPFRNSSLELLVTPWFVDIVPESPQNLLRRLNACLKLGGVWVNFGTLVFHTPNIADRLSYEEFMECAIAAGFEIVHQEFKEIPYMASPASAHRRTERILSIAARKVREVDSVQTFHFLPEWVTDNSLSVPLLPIFVKFFEEHRTYAQIFSLVDGKRSVNEISSILADMFQIHPTEARESFLKIAATLYEKQGSAFIF